MYLHTIHVTHLHKIISIVYFSQKGVKENNYYLFSPVIHTAKNFCYVTGGGGGEDCVEHSKPRRGLLNH